MSRVMIIAITVCLLLCLISVLVLCEKACEYNPAWDDEEDGHERR